MDDRLTPEEYLQKLESQISDNETEVPKQEAPVQIEQPKKKKKKRKKKHYLLRFVIFIAVVVGIIVLMRSSLFFVQTIEVAGNEFYTPAQVIEMSGLPTGKNLFFEVKTKPARYALLQTPYIRFVEIKRVLPNKLRIELQERIEYAAVPTEEGEFILIDNEGLVLSISDKQPSLPLLEGMNIVSLNIGSPLEIEQSYLLTDTLELLREVDATDLYFSRINFSTVLVRAYINDNYYCEGEPNEIKNNIENIRAMIADQNSKGINKGVIRVGSNNYLSFSPKID
ncbi:MAG: FtsQ-type POTRA domain-containing protein [Bacillota bacterium]|nr:FtsQ-type POTRA domain-containing protein [Bacillota bacterium]